MLLLGAGTALAVALGVALWLALPGLIEREVVRRGRDQGVELGFGSLDFGWNWEELTQVRATLIDVPGLTLWVDGEMMPGWARTPLNLTRGTHTIALRIDRGPARDSRLRCELAVPAGSQARATFLGGR